MATFSKRLFESLVNLSDMSQYLVVINNVQGISDQEADALKELAFAQDKRFIAAHQSFITDRNTNALVANWRKLLEEVKSDPKNSSSIKRPELESKKTLNRGLTLSSSLAKEKDTRITPDELIVIRDKVGLGNLDPKTLVAKARGPLKNKKTLTFDDFSKFMLNVHGDVENFNNLKKQQALKILFDNIDLEKTGEIDKNQALNNLIVLCGGTPESKSEATFMLYDLNGDGLISFDELLEHQISVFKLLHRIRPEAINKLGETPESLARATVESIFLEADTDGNGVLSLLEFQAWMKGELIPVEVKEEKKIHVETLKSKKESIYEKFQETRANLTSEASVSDLNLLKKTTGLGDVHVKDALKYFKSKNSTGYLTRKQFGEILKGLIGEYTTYKPSNEVFNSSVNQLYVKFDRDSNGVVDFSELFCGLSMLCAGNAGDKLKSACDSYDESSDGKIQYLEVVKYFQSVFSVLLGNEAKDLVSPTTLATVTAKDLFKQYGLDETGEITFEELKDWYETSRLLLS